MASAHLLVSGYVQGVGFRWWVMRKAQEYDLKGYVRNLYSGEVEVEVENEWWHSQVDPIYIKSRRLKRELLQ